LNDEVIELKLVKSQLKYFAAMVHNLMKKQSVWVPFLLCRIITVIRNRRKQDDITFTELEVYERNFGQVLSLVTSFDSVDKGRHHNILYRMLLPFHRIKNYDSHRDTVSCISC
jgi:hypothetical protein